MINSLTVRNYLGEEIKITLTEDEPDHGLLLTSMTGLGPVKADINTMELVTSDGSLYNSARVGERNIVLKFLFTGDIESTRHLTYKYFPEKKPLELIIDTTNRSLKTIGYVESNEPDIFSDKESANISILCPDPYFYSLSANVSKAEKARKLFEFPFECNADIVYRHSYILDSNNDNLLDYRDRPIEDTQLLNVVRGNIEFGEIISTPAALVQYDGHVNVGITIKIKFLGPCGNIAVYNSGSKQRMDIDISKILYSIGEEISSGDSLTITTSIGNKTAYYKKGSTIYNVLYALGDSPNWIYLVNGDNVFTYTSEYNFGNLELSVTNSNAYEGV